MKTLKNKNQQISSNKTHSYDCIKCETGFCLLKQYLEKEREEKNLKIKKDKYV